MYNGDGEMGKDSEACDVDGNGLGWVELAVQLDRRKINLNEPVQLLRLD